MLARPKRCWPLSGSGAPPPRSAHPAALFRGPPPPYIVRTARPSPPLHLAGRARLPASDRGCRTPPRWLPGSWPSARPRPPRCRRDPTPRGRGEAEAFSPPSPPAPHRRVPALLPGVAKPPPADPHPRRQGALVQPLGQAMGAKQLPGLHRHPLVPGTYPCDLLKVSPNF